MASIAPWVVGLSGFSCSTAISDGLFRFIIYVGARGSTSAVYPFPEFLSRYYLPCRGSTSRQLHPQHVRQFTVPVRLGDSAAETIGSKVSNNRII